MKTSTVWLTFALLATGVFTLATSIQSHAVTQTAPGETGGILATVLGDSRKMFANHFYLKADVYFHSGNYPSIFDQARHTEETENHLAQKEDQNGHEHGEDFSFFDQPTDWIDRFGRNFRVMEHTEGRNVREILPWLRISAAMDPHRVDTYTVAAYWLCAHLGRVDEAEQFLREGLKANPDSYEILYELGRLYYEYRHDLPRAKNIWLLAVRRWHEKEDAQKEPDFKMLEMIEVHLAEVEEKLGNPVEAIRWLEWAKPHSPNAEALERQIETLRKTAAQSSTGK